MKLSSNVSLWPLLLLCHVSIAAATRPKLLAGGTIIAFNNNSNNDTGPFNIIRGGSLLIDGDKIASIFDAAAPPPPDALPADTEVVDCTDKIITPGFIDTHRHGWQTAFKTLGSNTTLAEYAMRYSAAVGRSLFTPEDLYVSQLAGTYEALAAGVTTILDHAHHTWTREHAEAGWRASVDSGARVFFGYTFQNTSTGFQVPQQMDHWRELYAEESHGRATLCMAYDDFTNNPESIIRSVVDFAKYDTPFHPPFSFLLSPLLTPTQRKQSPSPHDPQRRRALAM